MNASLITMEQPFFKERLSKFNIASMIPNETERDFIHTSIFTELGRGIFTQEAKNCYFQIMGNLSRQGAEGIIFACTRIPLLIRQNDCKTPIFDTTLIHATAAVDFALAAAKQ
ncbi:MAG: aspartate/glutamate racemase family protein [Bacteroidota bacterium]